ncbi:MAG: exodeoxyribonuclease III [Alphaproteobacteria bacterium]|nr:exodeoxyribonuclease III [Alphaproteobacteria bacterium]
MKIASWNVNSIKARLTHVKDWLATAQPDVLLLQELKGLEFPDMEFTALGYHSKCVCQKSYNGVATLSKSDIDVICDYLPNPGEDDQARYLEADINGLRVINIYLPNGNPAPGEKFDYKLGWMDRLYARLKALREARVPFLVGGDFNVIPEDRDCYDATAWEGDALFRPESRAKFRALLNLGLYDAFRIFNSEPGQYTFWDYQAGRWQKNQGIRIDHFLCSPEVTDRLANCAIDRDPRGKEKPSDHTPVIVEVNRP